MLLCTVLLLPHSVFMPGKNNGYMMMLQVSECFERGSLPATSVEVSGTQCWRHRESDLCYPVDVLCIACHSRCTAVLGSYLLPAPQHMGNDTMCAPTWA